MDEQKEGQVNGRRGEDANLSKALEVTVSQDSIRGFQAVTDTLRQFREQNASLMAEIARAATAYDMLTKNIADSLAVAADFSKIIDAQLVLPDISGLVRPPAYEALYSANLSISNLFDTTNVIAKSFAQLPSVSEIWQSQLQPVRSVLETVQYSNLALNSHLAQISELSVLAQASLHQLPWDQIGSALQIGASMRSAIQSSFLDFTQAYSGFFGSLEEQPAAIVWLPPFASELPAVEFFNETNLLESITIREDEDIEFVEQKQQIRQEIRTEADDKLAVLLAELDKNLVPLWEGARFSLESDHPDHTRHFATSLRELFTHVLHALAPDSEVKKWTNDPAHYYNKRPTRKARLLYVCRSINHGPFIKFLEIDIKATLKFLDLFQGGTHKIVVGYTTDQLTAMLIRMESALRFMLEIGRNGK